MGRRLWPRYPTEMRAETRALEIRVGTERALYTARQRQPSQQALRFLALSRVPIPRVTDVGVDRWGKKAPL
jgi:hypothetical protein